MKESLIAFYQGLPEPAASTLHDYGRGYQERRDNGFKAMILAGANANEAPQRLGISIKKTKTNQRGETRRD